METFNLIKDQHVRIWRRTKCKIKADSLEEAVELVKNDDYEDCECEFLYETEEELEPFSLEDPPTVEIFDENYKLLYSN